MAATDFGRIVIQPIGNAGDVDANRCEGRVQIKRRARQATIMGTGQHAAAREVFEISI